MVEVPLHNPDMKEDDPEKSGLICFMDKDRECGPDCMSYLSNGEVPEGNDYRGKQWAHCHLLINAHRAGKHLVILAEIGDQLVKKVKQQHADQQRNSQPSPPSPR